MQDTMEQIEIIAEKTGVNLDAATRPGYDLAIIRRKLRAATKGSIGDARGLAQQAARSTPEEFDQKWDTALRQGIAAVIGKELSEAANDMLFALEDKAQKNMAWDALGLLSAHVDKLARDLLKLDVVNIRTAEDAIETGKTKDYTRAKEIIDQLHEIAGLPIIDRLGLPVWVLIKPPTLPDARPNTRGDNLADDHTDDELRLIKQATDIDRANGFRDQILIATRHGWPIEVATSENEYTTRSRGWYAASHLTVGAITRSI